MHLEAHAALGWVIGNVGQTDRRLRAWCVAAAVLPDIDAAPYLFGPEAYGRWHHTFGHNVFLWAIVAAAAGVHCRSAPAFGYAAAAFGSHLVTDAFFSGWYLYPFWPWSRWEYMPKLHVGLEHPVNVWLIYAGLVAVLVIAARRRRTPMELFWPKFDRVVVSIFEKGDEACDICGRPANQRCSACGRFICIRHARINRKADLKCPACSDLRPGL